MRFLLTCCTFIALSASAWAHPGHGTTEPETVTHWFIEPQHNWWIAVALILAAIIIWIRTPAESSAKAVERKEK